MKTNSIPRSALQCLVEGCSSPVKAKNLCNKHYSRVSRHGSPHVYLNGRVRNWLDNLKHDTDACADFPFALNSKGYGVVSIEGVNTYAHRYVMDCYGPTAPDAKSFVLHSCDNPKCCNLRHLRWGSQFDNMKDMADRSRDRWARYHQRRAEGAKEDYGVKITEEEVKEVRRLTGTETQAATAERFGISQQHVSAIQLRKTWKHVQ